jgi:hypothetical protein
VVAVVVVVVVAAPPTLNTEKRPAMMSKISTTTRFLRYFHDRSPSPAPRHRCMYSCVHPTRTLQPHSHALQSLLRGHTYAHTHGCEIVDPYPYAHMLPRKRSLLLHNCVESTTSLLTCAAAAAWSHWLRPGQRHVLLTCAAAANPRSHLLWPGQRHVLMHSSFFSSTNGSLTTHHTEHFAPHAETRSDAAVCYCRCWSIWVWQVDARAVVGRSSAQRNVRAAGEARVLHNCARTRAVVRRP